MPTMFQAALEDLATESAGQPYDAVVVGGGSSGLTTTATLAQAGKRVALLEAGPAPFLTHLTNVDLRFAVPLGRNLRDAVAYSPDLAEGGKFGNNFGCFAGRGLFWNGATPRFSDEDLGGWPLTSADLKEGYDWAEEQYRVSRRMGQSELASRIIEKLRAADFAAEPGPFAVDDAPLTPGRLSAGIASGLGLFFRHAGAAVASGQVRVATQTLVRRVQVSGERATGVVACADGAESEIRAGSVVLAGGGIESIKLAALSGVPDPNERIGKGLQEHLFYFGLFSAPDLYDPSQPDAAIVYVRAPTQDANQWELHAPGERIFAIDDGTPWQPEPSTPYHFMIRSFAATEKRDENFVESREGPLGSSLVHFGHSEADERTKEAILQSARRFTAALGLEPTDDQGVDGRGRFRGPGSSYHEAGGLDMGTDPTTSVTDPDGRFHTVPNLVSVDAAAFPQIGATNPHLTIVAVARRKAQALARSLK